MDSHIFEIAEYAKKKLAGIADNFVITAVVSKASQIKFSNNKIAKTATESMSDLGFFVTKNKKILITNVKGALGETVAEPSVAGHAGTEIQTGRLAAAKKKIDETVKQASKFLRFIQPKPDYFGIADGPFKYKKILGLLDKKIENFSLDSVDVVELGINAAMKEGAERTNGIFQLGFADGLLMTSSGVMAESKSTSAYFSIRAMIGKDASGHMTSNARALPKLDVAGAAEFAGGIARLARNPVAGKAGRYDVVFAPLAFSVIAQNFGEAASIFDVEANLSFFKGRLGQQIGPKGLNIYDDPTIPGGIASSEHDAEGTPTKKNTIIKNGMLNTYLHNTSTARKYKTKTTGNAGLIAPGPHNVVFEAGRGTRDDLIKEIKQGIYITNLWYLRYQNISNGDFSVIPRDGMFLIENGEIKKPIKQLRVSENMLSILKNIYLRGRDVKQMAGWETSIPVLAPHVIVKNVNITQPTG